MARYTTVRISIRDKERLERIARLLGFRSLASALRYLLDVAERELEEYRGDLNAVLASLKHAVDVGETSGERVDEYLYGGGL